MKMYLLGFLLMTEINGIFVVTNLCDEYDYKRKPARIIFFEFSTLGDTIDKVNHLSF